MPSIKQISFRGHNGRPIDVLYVIIDGRCTFTALGQGPSSINAAEQIIQSICEVEQRTVRELEFYDLQTSQGYETKQPGQFEYDRIRLNLPGASPQWFATPLPNEIRRLFATQIG